MYMPDNDFSCAKSTCVTRLEKSRCSCLLNCWRWCFAQSWKVKIDIPSNICAHNWLNFLRLPRRYTSYWTNHDSLECNVKYAKSKLFLYSKVCKNENMWTTLPPWMSAGAYLRWLWPKLFGGSCTTPPQNPGRTWRLLGRSSTLRQGSCTESEKPATKPEILSASVQVQLDNYQIAKLT